MHAEVALEQEAHHLLVAKACTEVQWNVVLVILGIHCVRTN